MRSYREVLAIRDVWTTLVLAAVTRIPMFGLGMVITLHVVQTLGLSYGLAGVVTTVVTVASMISSPWRGSLIDRKGLRRTMAPSVVILLLVFGVAPWVGYIPLLVLAGIGSLWNYPVYTVPRQVLIARTEAEQRRAALSLDAVSVEICYMIGPTVAIIAASSLGTRPTIVGCSVVAALGALGLMALDPPTASPEDEPAAEATTADPAPTKVSWVSPHVLAILVAVAAAGFCLGGLELTTVGAMRAMGHTEAIGWVLAASGLGSAVGGVIYGTLPRGATTSILLVALGVTTTLAALAHTPVQAALLLLVSGLFCAPTLTSSIDQLSALTPAQVRGTVIGWQGSCLNGGIALAAPSVGSVLDSHGWPWGFVLAGVLATGVGVVVHLVMGRRTRPRAGGVDPLTDEFLGRGGAQ